MTVRAGCERIVSDDVQRGRRGGAERHHLVKIVLQGRDKGHRQRGHGLRGHRDLPRAVRRIALPHHCRVEHVPQGLPIAPFAEPDRLATVWLWHKLNEAIANLLGDGHAVHLHHVGAPSDVGLLDVRLGLGPRVHDPEKDQTVEMDRRHRRACQGRNVLGDFLQLPWRWHVGRRGGCHVEQVIGDTDNLPMGKMRLQPVKDRNLGGGRRPGFHALALAHGLPRRMRGCLLLHVWMQPF